MNSYNIYNVCLRHDNGKFTTEVIATSKADAIQKVLKEECAPESAVVDVTLKQRLHTLKKS